MADNGSPKGKREASVETQLLYQRLRDLEVGQMVPYAELEGIIGISVREGRGNGYLTSARNMVRSLHDNLLICVRGEGVLHGTDADVAEDIEKSKRSVRRTARRALNKTSCIKDYGALPNDVKVRHNVNLSLLGAVRQATSKGTQKRLTSVIQESGSALPVAKTLELFK